MRAGASSSQLPHNPPPRSEVGEGDRGSLFNGARRLRSPEIEALFEIFKLRVDELRLVETRIYEWIVVYQRSQTNRSRVSSFEEL